ncbi:MAG: DNA primase/helicase [Caudoviricetes sp.]|nr:MAG: DNA primase/helicase [Caudoviricetes sp.]
MAKKFAFDAGTPSNAGNGEGSNVDFDALAKHVVEAVGCADKPESMIGVVSGVIDLGLQAQDDAKMEWKGTDEERAEVEAKAARGESTEYFETLPNDKQVPTLYKRWKVKSQRCVAITVDFPNTLVNKGQFFDKEGGGEELPFRGLLNNEFGIAGIGKVVGKPYSLREQRNDDGSWSLKNNTILFKLGQATGQLDAQGNFKPAYLGNLIGEAALFNVHVFLNEYKGKQYLNEKMAFNGPVPKMMQSMIPTLDDKHMYVINFKGEQDLDALKTLRQSVINTMKQAEDFEGSDVQKALIEIGKIKVGEQAQKPAAENKPEQQKAPVQQAPAPQPAVDFDAFDDDIPFAPIGLQEGKLFLHMI